MRKTAVPVLLMAVLFSLAGLCAAENSQEHALVWQESFIDYAAVVPGWQAAEVDGRQALQYDGAAGKVEIQIMFPVTVKHGRVEFMAYQPSGTSSNFGIKPYPKNHPNFIDFWLSKGGEARLWRDIDPNNPNDIYPNGSWYEFAFEWDAAKGTFAAYAKINGTWVQKWTTAGVIEAPLGLYLDGGSGGSGAIADLRLYDLNTK